LSATGGFSVGSVMSGRKRAPVVNPVSSLTHSRDGFVFLYEE
jgi:hypothetical protein